LVDPLPKPLKCIERLLENIRQAGQRFLNAIHISRPVKCQLKMTNVQGDKAPAKRQKMLKNSTHPQRPSSNNPWASRHHWDQLWVLPGDLSRKFEHMPYCSFITTTHPAMHLWKPQSLLLTTWLSSPFLPTHRT
jgi:hypothetical protein